MSNVINKNYQLILNGLKDKIRQARLRTALMANAEVTYLYWELGNEILRQQNNEGWGTKVIDRLANDLKHEFPDMKGLSLRNIKYMRAFAEAYPNFLIVQRSVAQLENNKNVLQNNSTSIVQRSVAQLKKNKTNKKQITQHAVAQLQTTSFVQHPAAQLPWGHNCTLLDKLRTTEERLFYAAKTIENGWSRNVMAHQIESNLYKRQGKTINNFKTTVPATQSDLINETFKNPYLFDFLSLGEKMREADLEKALIANVKKLMLEMGKGFAFVGNQYNIKVGNKDRSLDLLFYNFHLCSQFLKQ